MANGQAEETDAVPAWGDTPRMDQTDFHDRGGQAWRYDERGVYLRGAPDTPLRSVGKPATVRAILASYGREIRMAAVKHQIPPELIVMTIATETAIYRSVGFTGPKTFRWEAHHGTYSGGPMQVLETTARDIIRRLRLDYPASDVPAHTMAK
jgi:peptidoglycan L-alanyl-D-glutamate endopeptidase CwlK